jgi:Mg-chelatase subunit ChlD
MKICFNCAASNLDSADFCSECGIALTLTSAKQQKHERSTLKQKSKSPNTQGQNSNLPKLNTRLTFQRKERDKPLVNELPSPPAKQQAREPVKNVDANYLAGSITKQIHELSLLHKKQSAEIMFVLDCTESMKGEINAIRDAIISFVDMIESDGVRVRIGMVEFRDRFYNEEHRVLLFNGTPFTNDSRAFKEEVMKLTAYGGGDEPESSLDALMLALKQPFNNDAQKVLVLITDAPPHVPDKETQSIEEVLAQIQRVAVSQFYLIIPVQEEQNQIYLRLCEGTRSMAFDLGKGNDFSERAEDFKRTLMSLGKTISAATK